MLLTIRQMQVCYGKQKALDIEKPIVIEKGDRIGVIGSNGAGKTTMVKAMLGLVGYRGSILTDLKPEQIGVHMQFNEYAATMSVKHVMEAILNTRIKDNEKLKELIAYFEFEDCLSKKFNTLSGGQKQRFTIIMVMIQEAPLTIYDEVTSGLDFEARQRLMEKLVEWYDGKDNTLLVVSHYYEELEQLANKILLLDQGKVIAYGKTGELFHTYCGNSVFILDRNRRNEELTEEIRKVKAPEHLIACTCRDEEEERALAGQLIANHVNFKRSDNDIEIMSINAKEQFWKERGKEK